MGSEQERLAAARTATAQFIDGMEKRIRRQLELLEELRKKELPTPMPEEKTKVYGRPAPVEEEPKQAFDFDKEPTAPTTQEKADALIEEIGLRIEESLGGPTIGDMADQKLAPKAEPAATHGELPPAKQKLFEELRFGRNGDRKGR